MRSRHCWSEQARDPGKRVAQRRLALEVTSRVHGADTAEAGDRGERDPVRRRSRWWPRSPDVLEVLEGEVPVASLSLAELSKGVPLVDALVTAGLASSKADAKRGVEQKGFSVNGEPAAPGRVAAVRRTCSPGGTSCCRRGRRTTRCWSFLG